MISDEQSGVGKNDSRAWYLVFSRPQQERIALENLQRQGYEVYLPLMQKRIRRGRQFHQRTSPLFPRYLFIHLSERLDDWGPIRSTFGVKELVRFGQKPARVPDELIVRLRSCDNEEGVHELPLQALQPGDKVRFVEGTMTGYEAIFDAKSSGDRVIVLMNIAGKHTRIAVHETSIETAN